MTKEEVIKEIESFQIDLSDDNKIYLLQIHFPKNASKEEVEGAIGRLCYDIAKTRSKDPVFWEFPKNIILFPSTDDIYIEKLEVSKEDKLK